MARNQQKDKALLLKGLRDMGNVEIACQRAGVPRATFYRWRKEDEDFTKQVDEALNHGNDRINDLAESQLIVRIKDGDIKAIMYRLNNRHPLYSYPRVYMKEGPIVTRPIQILSPKKNSDGSPRIKTRY